MVNSGRRGSTTLLAQLAMNHLLRSLMFFEMLTSRRSYRCRRHWQQ